MTQRSLTVVFALSLLAACGGPANVPADAGRNLRGVAPEGATVYAIDTSGRRSDGQMDGSRFDVALAPGSVAHLFVVDADGTHVLRFASGANGENVSAIPDFTGAIELGQLTVVNDGRRNPDPVTFAESETNPLEGCDSDGDGQSDFEDSDDDDDGVEDDEDDDDAGTGVADADEDLDSDDDGQPDVCDDDDDDDGVPDDEDDDDGDADDDGVDDDDDLDDDNDGAEDDEDEDEDEDEAEDSDR